MNETCSPLPWSVRQIGQYHTDEYLGVEIVDANGEVVADNQKFYPTTITEANARRIVACVNACAGLSAGLLESSGDIASAAKEQARHVASVERQRDQLLSSLEMVRGDINWMLNSRQFLNAIVFNYIDEAIAAVKGAK